METKVCTKCGVEKTLDGFSKDRTKSCGFCSQCKECKYAFKKAYWRSERGKKVNSDYNKIKYQRHREKVIAKQKEYYSKNKDSVAIKNKEYRKKNSQELKQNNKKWREDNIDYVKECDKKKNKRVVETLPDYYIRHLLKDQGFKDVPNVAIDIKRKIVQINRELKKSKKS